MHLGAETEVQLDKMFNLTAVAHLEGNNLVVELLLFTLYVTGFVAYVPVITVFLKYRKKEFANPFYKMAVALGLCDMLLLGTIIVLALPLTLDLFDITVRTMIWSGVFIYCIGFYITLLMVLIAINRLCSGKLKNTPVHFHCDFF